jgi:2-polyprenyl-3-methyl-5-hydroxy-6-metoxy-1,4-benzoquinol methylase
MLTDSLISSVAVGIFFFGLLLIHVKHPSLRHARGEEPLSLTMLSLIAIPPERQICAEPYRLSLPAAVSQKPFCVESHADYALWRRAQVAMSNKLYTTHCAHQLGQELPSSLSGFWELPPGYDYYLDEPLADAISLVVEGGTLADLGAGLGMYSRYILDTGRIRNVTAYEGMPDVEKRTNGFVRRVDLSMDDPFVEHYDWIMSLEVGEHIPPPCMAAFLNTVAGHARKGVVISWATPGQGGAGHFNELDSRTIRGEMARRGFFSDHCAEGILRSVSALSHFQRTVMVFRRNAV